MKALGFILIYNLKRRLKPPYPCTAAGNRGIYRIYHFILANYLFCIFRVVDPFVKCFLFKSYCLSLYDCSLWSHSSSSLKLCEVALKKSLRNPANLIRLLSIVLPKSTLSLPLHSAVFTLFGLLPYLHHLP